MAIQDFAQLGRELREHFENGSLEIENEVDEVLFIVAEKIRQDAYTQAPVDTGMLRNSLGVSKKADGYHIGTFVEYAPYLEFGTKHQRPQPFLRPSLYHNIPFLFEKLKEVF